MRLESTINDIRIVTTWVSGNHYLSILYVGNRHVPNHSFCESLEYAHTSSEDLARDIAEHGLDECLVEVALDHELAEMTRQAILDSFDTKREAARVAMIQAKDKLNQTMTELGGLAGLPLANAWDNYRKALSRYHSAQVDFMHVHGMES